MNKKSILKIGIISSPMGQANIKPFSNYLNILEHISDNLYIVPAYGVNKSSLDTIEIDSKKNIYEIKHRFSKNTIVRIYRYILLQLKMSWHILNLFKRVDVWIFFLGDGLILPIMLAKLLNKKTIISLGGFLEKEIHLNYTQLGMPILLLKKLNLFLVDAIILYSSNLISAWKVDKYKKKIYIAPRHYIDFNKFYVDISYSERQNLIGYIGRFSKEKGTLNFVESIPLILKHKKDLFFLVAGSGQLQEKINKCAQDNNISDHTLFESWIPHENLPVYLNKLKLIVLPSDTEGLPNIMLEAMACGTPVLATPVGSIPDIIKDEETGFIMENNSIECISKNVIRVFQKPDLETIIENAKDLVEREFTFKAAVERYNNIIVNL
ncbi:LPS glycosyltransferase [Methanolobus psychrophilus R15]|nr:LPS glycosyltransferase [Methanolobus psychrophilus R15]